MGVLRHQLSEALGMLVRGLADAEGFLPIQEMAA